MSCLFPRTMPCCVHYTGRCTQSLFSGMHVRVDIRDCLGIITGLKADRTSSGLQTLSSLPLNSHTYVRTYVGVQTTFVGYCQNTSWERGSEAPSLLGTQGLERPSWDVPVSYVHVLLEGMHPRTLVIVCPLVDMGFQHTNVNSTFGLLVTYIVHPKWFQSKFLQTNTDETPKWNRIVCL